jgi:predicted phosphodiesterase
MRVALISDIHANWVSLEAVLGDIDRQQVDQIVCLGDVAALGPQPREVLARLEGLDCACVMGNHDFHLLNLDAEDEYAHGITELTAWCADRLSEADFEYLRSFQPTLRVPLDAHATLLCFHGSPRSDQDFIFATTPVGELDEMLAGYTATVLAGGHTHVQMSRQHKGAMIVNPGSVGWPVEEMPFEPPPRFLPWAEYAIVSWVEGVLGIELRRVPIDLDAVKQAAIISAYPGAHYWVECWITPEMG